MCIYFWRGTIYFQTITVGICLLTSSFCYLRIYRMVRRHQLQIQAQQQAVERLSAQHNLNLLRSKKSALNTLIYDISMILCYTPLFIHFLVRVLSDNDWKTLWSFASALVFLNSSINPFLYWWRLIELRVAVVKTLRKMLCKQTQETQILHPNSTQCAAKSTHAKQGKCLKFIFHNIHKRKFISRQCTE